MEDMSQDIYLAEEGNVAVSADASVPTSPQEDEGWESRLHEEAEALRHIYPTFDLAQFMADDGIRALVEGQVPPTLRQVYEMLNPAVLVEAQVQQRVEETIATAVAEAVERAEKNLLSHIQARGMRPRENGKNASVGVRTHPAVHKLTRDDRAKLALMAQLGETIRL